VRLVGTEADPVIKIYGTHDVAVQGFVIEGGYYGVLVEESEAVTLADNRIVGAWLAGIRLSRAQARIVGNEVRDTRSPYGMGIELANTHSRAESVIAYNTVTGNAHEGIVLHNAGADLDGNLVTNNNLRGIAITEMSMATVQNNTLLDNADAGLYIVDSSMAKVEGNHIGGTRPGPFGWAHDIRVEYYAEVMLKGNRLDGGSQAIVAWYNGLVEGDGAP
jgi:parallel beta-helix repeat protein